MPGVVVGAPLGHAGQHRQHGWDRSRACTWVFSSTHSTTARSGLVALDPFTLAALMAHVETLNRERKDLGPDYQDHGLLFCWENGTPPHPDTITRRFKKLSAAAGLPEIDLHDVRHSYATAVGTRRSTGRPSASALGTPTSPSP